MDKIRLDDGNDTVIWSTKYSNDPVCLKCVIIWLWCAPGVGRGLDNRVLKNIVRMK